MRVRALRIIGPRDEPAVVTCLARFVSQISQAIDGPCLVASVGELQQGFVAYNCFIYGKGRFAMKTMIASGLAVVLMAASAWAGELKSGLQPGELVGAFDVEKCGG